MGQFSGAQPDVGPTPTPSVVDAEPSELANWRALDFILEACSEPSMRLEL